MTTYSYIKRGHYEIHTTDGDKTLLGSIIRVDDLWQSYRPNGTSLNTRRGLPLRDKNRNDARNRVIADAKRIGLIEA